MPTLTGFTAISSNRKTGPIPTTTSAKETCWDGCPFYEKGCYGKGGPQNIHWNAISSGERGYVWDQFLFKIKSIKRGQLWRHNVTGDLPVISNGVIDGDKTNQLVNANKGKKGFTYTHHPLTNNNLAIIKNSNNNGFTINISTESIEIADKVMSEHGIPAVAVVHSDNTDRFYKTESGRKVITCPATIHENVNCSTCGLCQIADRQFIIAFPAHGNAKKTVNEIVGL